MRELFFQRFNPSPGQRPSETICRHRIEAVIRSSIAGLREKDVSELDAGDVLIWQTREAGSQHAKHP
jgi:hypothetical protein